MVPRLPTYRSFGKRSLANRFAILHREINRIRIQNDADAVHDLRVASRRYHAAALLFKECADPRLLTESERRVRRIRKSAGAVRDGDVQLSFIGSLLQKKIPRQYRSGLERVDLRLSQRREKRTKEILSAIQSFYKSDVAGKMKRSLDIRTYHRSVFRPLSLRRRAEQEIALHVTQLLRYEQFVYQSTAVTELHALRIAAKRLRYVMEIFNPVYRGRLKPFIRTIRTIQDTLGEMHDCDVWLLILPGFIEKERARTAKFLGGTATFPHIEKGILYLSEYARTHRLKQYNAFLRSWKLTERQKTWKTLTELTKST